MSAQWHPDARSYLTMVRAEIPHYDHLQDLVADATADLAPRLILDLGSGTGVTAARVLARHPTATLVGIDSSPAMLDHARHALPKGTFLQQRLEGPLPAGPFDVVVSALAVHHLPSTAKRDLFTRVAAVVRPGGRFVLCDVVVPTEPVDTPVPLEPGVDRPDSAADQLAWLTAAGFDAAAVFVDGDLAVLRGDRR